MSLEKALQAIGLRLCGTTACLASSTGTISATSPLLLITRGSALWLACSGPSFTEKSGCSGFPTCLPQRTGSRSRKELLLMSVPTHGDLRTDRLGRGGFLHLVSAPPPRLTPQAA